MAKGKAMNQSMLDEFEIKGFWWLPNSEKEVAGTLIYSSEKIELDLLGNLKEDTFLQDKEIRLDIILGFSDKGEEFTLIDCLNINSTGNFPGIATEQYSVNSFFVGGHFLTKEDIKFNSATFNFTHFTKWLNTSAFEEITRHNTDDYSFKQKELIFKEQDTFNIYIPSINSYVEETYVANFNKDFNEKVSWTYKSGLTITPDEFKEFKWFRNNINTIKNLVMLFVGNVLHFEKIAFTGEMIYDDFGEREKKYLYFYRQNMNKFKEEFSMRDIMITYNDIKDYFEQIINRWIQKQEQLQTVTNLYFSDFYMDGYLDTAFLNAVQTLEIYHRHSFNGNGVYFPQEQYEIFSNKVKEFLGDNDFPEEFSQKLKGSLEHGNEYNLQKRLKLIIQSLEEDTRAYIIGNNRDKKRFIQQLVDTRNYLTHYDKGDKQNILKNSEKKFYALQRLKALTTIILLKEIGVEERTIIQKIKESKKFSYTISKAHSIL